MAGWHHRLNGHEFEQAPGVGDGQESLACCSPWGHKDSGMTERLNWTESWNRKTPWRVNFKALIGLLGERCSENSQSLAYAMFLDVKAFHHQWAFPISKMYGTLDKVDVSEFFHWGCQCLSAHKFKVMNRTARTEEGSPICFYGYLVIICVSADLVAVASRAIVCLWWGGELFSSSAQVLCSPGFSCCRAQALGNTRIFPERGSNLCLPDCQADSLPTGPPGKHKADDVIFW